MVAAVDGRVDSLLVEPVVAVDAGVGGRAGVGQRLKDELVPGRGRIPKRWRGSGAVNRFPMKGQHAPALDDDEQGPRDRAPSLKRWRRNCLANQRPSGRRVCALHLMGQVLHGSEGQPGRQSGVTMVAAVDGRDGSSLAGAVVGVDAGVGVRAIVEQRRKDKLVPGRARLPEGPRGSGVGDRSSMKGQHPSALRPLAANRVPPADSRLSVRPPWGLRPLAALRPFADRATACPAPRDRSGSTPTPPRPAATRRALGRRSRPISSQPRSQFALHNVLNDVEGSTAGACPARFASSARSL